jgi:hypothetical protein
MESLTSFYFTICFVLDDWNVGSNDQFALVVFVLERAHTKPVMQVIQLPHTFWSFF